MSKTKTKFSTVKVVDRKTGKIKGYLSRRDEERGIDIMWDKKGFEIIAL